TAKQAEVTKQTILMGLLMRSATPSLAMAEDHPAWTQRQQRRTVVARPHQHSRRIGNAGDLIAIHADHGQGPESGPGPKPPRGGVGPIRRVDCLYGSRGRPAVHRRASRVPLARGFWRWAAQTAPPLSARIAHCVACGLVLERDR